MAVTIGTDAGFVENAPVDPPTDPEFTNNTVDGWSLATKDTSPTTSVTVTEIGWYCNNATDEANFEVGLYDDSSGPNNLLSSSEAAKGTTSGWKKINGLDIIISPNTDYWIAFQLDSTTTSTNGNYESSGGPGRVADLHANTTLPPSGNWSSEISDVDGIYAVYAVYETTGAQTFAVSLTDVSALTDTFYKSKIANISQTDSVSLVDSFNKSKIANKGFADAVSLADSFSKSKLANKGVADAISLSYNLEINRSARTFSTSQTDSVSLVDSFNKSKIANVSSIDAISLVDTFYSTKIAALSLTDSINLVDSITTSKEGIHTLALDDSLSLSDTFNVVKIGAEPLSLTESVTLTDSISIVREARTFGVAVTDSITLTKTLTKRKITGKGVSEIVSITDTFSISKVTSVALADPLTLTDEFSSRKSQTYSFSATDTIFLKDVFLSSKTSPPVVIHNMLPNKGEYRKTRVAQMLAKTNKLNKLITVDPDGRNM